MQEKWSFYEELKSISSKQVVYGKEWIVSCFSKAQ
jgi:hypothetical protein